MKHQRRALDLWCFLAEVDFENFLHEACCIRTRDSQPLSFIDRTLLFDRRVMKQLGNEYLPEG